MKQELNGYTGTNSPCRKCGYIEWYYFKDWRGKTSRRCKACSIRRSASYLKQGKGQWKPESRAAYNAKRLEQINDQFHEYLSQHCCRYCGEAEPMFLDFDHVKGEKKFDISQMKSCKFSDQRTQEEVAKCQTICIRCHRFLTQKRGNYYYYRRMVKEGHPLVDKFKDVE